ncbi:MAG TPA: GNAT family N-acetyltransferase [Candidatus Saccharimonadales bacterium]|nr:GNAT family N-acetyltransferase [Candidatus Saccharimonadales bacterium]
MNELYTSPTYEVRPPQTVDVPGLIELDIKAWQTGEGRRVPPFIADVEVSRLQSPEHRQDIARDVVTYQGNSEVNPANEFWGVVVEGDAVVGSVKGSGTSAAVELVAIQVDPDYHSQGVAQELVSGFFDWADSQHPGKDVFVSVDSRNEHARAFYAKLGFQAASSSSQLGGVLHLVRRAGTE